MNKVTLSNHPATSSARSFFNKMITKYFFARWSLPGANRFDIVAWQHNRETHNPAIFYLGQLSLKQIALYEKSS
jgi:hypothetical protein